MTRPDTEFHIPGRVGFVSLGCAKATVDSERILTELRAQGYEMSGTYDDADLVIVNTCGFIDAAVEESLEAIGEALDENEYKFELLYKIMKIVDKGAVYQGQAAA